MNVTKVLTTDYDKRTPGARAENKPNSKPIKANFMRNKPKTTPNEPDLQVAQTNPTPYLIWLKPVLDFFLFFIFPPKPATDNPNIDLRQIFPTYYLA